MNTNKQTVTLLLLFSLVAAVVSLQLQTSAYTVLASTATEEEEEEDVPDIPTPVPPAPAATTPPPLIPGAAVTAGDGGGSGDIIRTKMVLFGIQGGSDIVTWVSSSNKSATTSGNVSSIDMAEDNQTNGVGSVYLALRGVAPASGIPIEACAVQIGVNQVTCDSTFMTGMNTTNVLQIPLSKQQQQQQQQQPQPQ